MYLIFYLSLNIFWFFRYSDIIYINRHPSNLPRTSRPILGHAGSVPTAPPTWRRKKIHAVSWRIIMTTMIITMIIFIMTMTTTRIIMKEKTLIIHHTIYILRIPWRH